MVELLVGEGKLGEALAFAEQAKARVLLDVLQRGRLSINKAMTAQEQERERKIKSELSALNLQLQREAARPQPDRTPLTELRARLEKARFELESFTNNLYVTHPELRVQRGEAPPVTLERLGELLPDADGALVEFVVGEKQTLLFVVTRSEPEMPPDQKAGLATPARLVPPTLKVYRLDVKRNELIERVNRFRRRLAQADLAFSAEALSLHDLLLKPARGELQGKTRIVIVPDGALWELPFQALRSADGHYVIEEHAISYVPSFSVLHEMTRAKRKQMNAGTDTRTLLALGNPTTRAGANQDPRGSHARTLLNDGSAPLPEAERQVRMLERLFGRAQSNVWTGGAATEELVKRDAGKSRFLHLATHGVLDDASPMYSYVKLAPEGNRGDEAGEDGMLEAWELMQMDLRTEMVVLSACETARGRIKSGEGMIGFSWALFVAGNPTTVVSQWKVESASTTELMLGFYRNLLPPRNPHRVAAASARRKAAPVTKAEALRQASLELLRSDKYSHPFYWAGFVIVGKDEAK